MKILKLLQNFVTYVTAAAFSLVKPVLEEPLDLLNLLQLFQLQLAKFLFLLLQTLHQFFSLLTFLSPFQPDDRHTILNLLQIYFQIFLTKTDIYKNLLFWLAILFCSLALLCLIASTSAAE